MIIAVMLLLSLALCSEGVRADDNVPQDYAVTTITAYHFDQHRGYNERNFGVGLERDYSDTWGAGVGTFKNSYYRETVYAWAIYTPWDVMGWRTGALVGGVTGYDQGRVSGWLTGVARRDFGRYVGVNIAIAPTAVALQMKWRFK